MFTYFTEVAAKDVVDRHNRYVGHPFDLLARLDEPYPRVSFLVIAHGTLHKRYFVIPWKDVHVTGTQFQLRVPVSALEPKDTYSIEEVVSLKKSILDQQVVDTFNRKVVRVNDLHFLRVDNDLRLAHVDIGVRGLIRRLGFQSVVDTLVRHVHRHSRYLTDEGLISWKYVQPLSIQSAGGKVQLNVDIGELKKIPPPDISEMLMELDPFQRAALLRTLDVATQVDIITELDIKWQKDLLEDLDPQAVGLLIERMPADEATDLLGALPARDAERILGMLSAKKARELTELMTHESNSAGGIMTTELITLHEAMTVGEAINHIRLIELQKKSETIHYAYIVDAERKLMGVISFRQLMLDPLETRVVDVMQTKPPSARVDESVRDVAYEMDKYNLFALPVVDDDNVLQGLITVDDVLHLAVEEAWGRKTGL